MSKRLSAYDIKVKPKLHDIEYWSQFDTDAILADKLGIHIRTLYTYKKKHQELVEAIQRGREKTAQKLRTNLFTLACGYEETETIEKVECNDQNGTVTTKIIKKRSVAPSLKAITLLLSDYDPTFHEDRDDYDLKMRALEIQKEKTQKEDNEWEG